MGGQDQEWSCLFLLCKFTISVSNIVLKREGQRNICRQGAASFTRCSINGSNILLISLSLNPCFPKAKPDSASNEEIDRIYALAG